MAPYFSIRNITFGRVLCTHKFTVCFSPVGRATQYLDLNDFENTKKYFTTIFTQFPVFSLSCSSALNIVAFLILHLASLCIHKSPWSVFPVSPNFPGVTAKLPVFSQSGSLPSANEVWGKVIQKRFSVHRGGLCLGGLSPEGSLSRGSLSQGSLCLGGVCSGGFLSRETPRYGKERAVHILLECILVLTGFSLSARTEFLVFSVLWVPCYRTNKGKRNRTFLSSCESPRRLNVSALGTEYVVIIDDVNIARGLEKGDSPSGTRNAWTYRVPLLRVDSGNVTLNSLQNLKWKRD